MQENQPNKSMPGNEGNASNPRPDSIPSTGNQLIPEQGETYLREVANIEDVPDARDQQEMDEVLKKENGSDR